MSAPASYDEKRITAALSAAAAVDAIQGALRSGLDPASDPHRVSVALENGQFLLMPSSTTTFAGVKIATVAPGNAARGLPRIQASYLLFDAATLSLVATLDGTALTTLRTPAVSVAAVRDALARFQDPVNVVVYGAGPQGVGHVRALQAVKRVGSVHFVVRTPETAASAAAALGAVVAARSTAAEDAVRAADVVVTATSARTPLFPADWIKSGAVVVAVGSHEPDARELDAALLEHAQVVVEDAGVAAREAGDLILAADAGRFDFNTVHTMRDILLGNTALDGRTLVFKGTGMSWQDLVIAGAIHAAA